MTTEVTVDRASAMETAKLCLQESINNGYAAPYWANLGDKLLFLWTELYEVEVELAGGPNVLAGPELADVWMRAAAIVAAPVTDEHVNAAWYISTKLARPFYVLKTKTSTIHTHSDVFKTLSGYLDTAARMWRAGYERETYTTLCMLLGTVEMIAAELGFDLPDELEKKLYRNRDRPRPKPGSIHVRC